MEDYKKYHTQGEWITGSKFKRAVGTGNLIVAETDIDRDIPEVEQLANAILISAAPDLLDACIAAKEFLFAGREDEKQLDAYIQMTKAIQKAITQ